MAPPENLDAHRRLPDVFQANLFFLAAVLLGLGTGALKPQWGLLGVSIKQFLIFGVLPALFLFGAPAGSLRAAFRLRPIGWRATWTCLKLVLLNFIFAQGLSVVVIATIMRLGFQPHNPYSVLLEGRPPLWVVLLAMAVVPAFLEEWSFRGLLLSGYRGLGPRAWAYAGLMFGLMHMSFVRLPSLAALGMIFAYAAQRTGSLVPGMIMHMANNGLAIALAYSVAGGLDTGGGGDMAPPPWPAVAIWAAGAALVLPAIIAQLRALPAQAGPEATPTAPRLPETTADLSGRPGMLHPAAFLANWWPALAALALISLAGLAELQAMSKGIR